MAITHTGIRPEQVVLVTAGASGIGRCIAEAFLAHGCKVHVCDISEDRIKEFLVDNPGASASVTDVGDADQVKVLFEDFASRHKSLDILVNNAGIAGPTAAVEDIEPRDWDRTIAVDLSGQFYCTRLAVPLLKANGGGSIVNISSNAAFFGFPLRSAYTASKWALIGLTKTWAMELGSHNIRVNAVCPGSVEGERIETVIQREAAERCVDPDRVREVYKAQSSMHLFVSANDVANTVLFLCSDLGLSVSGQAMGIDGHTENLSSPS
jgi:NAD(P)-dependent dehydrogenase (short-subunit alcohol dehydrogenase family)